jgi:hypothetical protein
MSGKGKKGKRSTRSTRAATEQTPVGSDAEEEDFNITQADLPAVVADDSFPKGSQEEGEKVEKKTYLSACKNDEYRLPPGRYIIESRRDAEDKLAFVIILALQRTLVQGKIPYDTCAHVYAAII